jgi:hypothetical protein
MYCEDIINLTYELSDTTLLVIAPRKCMTHMLYIA